MKKTLLISTLMASLIFSSCSSGENKNAELLQQTTNTNTTSIPDFTRSYEGTINGKYGILMTLTKNKENLKGTYTYKSQGSRIKISGTIDDFGNLTINEFNDSGNLTGVFEGQLNNSNIVGQWTKPDGSKTMPFSISESSNSETTIIKAESSNSSDYSNWTGTYVDKFGSSLNIVGPDSDGAVTFHLLQANQNCIGEIKGTAYLTKVGVANFDAESDDCHINLTFNPGSIQVSEYNCENFRGSSCGTYDGWYNKK